VNSRTINFSDYKFRIIKLIRLTMEETETLYNSENARAMKKIAIEAFEESNFKDALNAY
jgi:hypothetical protein